MNHSPPAHYSRYIAAVAVLGAGRLGSLLAAHMANAGLSVLLLDRVPPGTSAASPRAARDAIAIAARDRLRRGARPALDDDDAARRIQVGNIEDHWGRLAEVDWIVEAIPDDLAAKRALLTELAGRTRPDAFVSSATAGLTRAQLVAGMPDDLRRRFLLTRFIPPVRATRLVELVVGPEFNVISIPDLRRFFRAVLGKGIVVTADRPLGVALSMGILTQWTALCEAERLGLKPAEADERILRFAAGHIMPPFATADRVGLDVVAGLAASMRDLGMLPPRFAEGKCHQRLFDHIAKGEWGRGRERGFYDWNAGGEIAQHRRVFIPAPHGWGNADGPLKALVDGSDPAAEYVWRVARETLSFAFDWALAGEPDPSGIDRAARWGFGIPRGPFELADHLGLAAIAQRMTADGHPVPELLSRLVSREIPGVYRDLQGEIQVFHPDSERFHPVDDPELWPHLAERPPTDGERSTRPAPHQGAYLRVVDRREDTTVADLGEGVALLVPHGEGGWISGDGVRSIFHIEERYGSMPRALVIANPDGDFIRGARMDELLRLVDNPDWREIERMVREIQEGMRRLKYAPYPIVVAPHGRVTNFGADLLLYADRAVVHADVRIGFQQALLGLVSPTGATKELLGRFSDAASREGPMPPIIDVFDRLFGAACSRSAADARALGFLRRNDNMAFDPEERLDQARRVALRFGERGYVPPRPHVFHLPGPGGALILEERAMDWIRRGRRSVDDLPVARALARLLTGGDTWVGKMVDEERMLELEREAFLSLAGEPSLKARLQRVREARAAGG